MKICILGTGLSGWLSCSILNKLDFVDEITIIGSSKIPPIGVGESTNLQFVKFLNRILNEDDLTKFISECDATVKYGVYYKNWCKSYYINFFHSQNDYVNNGLDIKQYAKTLINKEKFSHIHDIIGSKIWDFVNINHVSSCGGIKYPHTWHFDAGKIIKFLQELNLKSKKVKLIDDTIIDCKFLQGNQIEYFIGNDNNKYKADYFVNCFGDIESTKNIFKEQYLDLSNILLTNKAVFHPMVYTNKKEQFHPYTTAKTMKNGWRWTIPTHSRIGTGYVFSDKHISVDEAINEFLTDIGDKTLNPSVVSFTPKYTKTPFKINNCLIGMSAGFLEPLESSAIDLYLHSVFLLEEILKSINENKNKDFFSQKLINSKNVNVVNDLMQKKVMFWSLFVLQQYKTCWRNDTKFWRDYKNVHSDVYDNLIEKIILNGEDFAYGENILLLLTASARDLEYKTKIKQKPITIKQPDTKTIDHLEYINSFHEIK